MIKDKNIFPIHDLSVSNEDRLLKYGYKPAAFWFTGLSGSGKSTIALRIERRLFEQGYIVKIIDGDNTRSGLCKDLDFSLEGRTENIRRVAELNRILIESGVITLNSFISPTRELRSMAKNIIGEDRFYEVFVDASIEVCEARDVKGLYRKARAGEIKNFTGIDSPYEKPENPFLHVSTHDTTIERTVDQVIERINVLLNKTFQ